MRPARRSALQGSEKVLKSSLAAKGVPADFSAAAWLILSAGQTNEERVRRNLARDYYGALARQTND